MQRDMKTGAAGTGGIVKIQCSPDSRRYGLHPCAAGRRARRGRRLGRGRGPYPGRNAPQRPAPVLQHFVTDVLDALFAVVPRLLGTRGCRWMFRVNLPLRDLSTPHAIFNRLPPSMRPCAAAARAARPRGAAA
eukprot:gene14699-biopygen8124